MVDSVLQSQREPGNLTRLTSGSDVLQVGDLTQDDRLDGLFVLEGDSLGDVVDGYAQLSSLTGTHQEGLEVLLISLPGSGSERLDEAHDVADRDGRVDFREGLQETSEDDGLESSDVRSVVLILGNGLDERSNHLASGQGMEVDLERVEEVNELGGNSVEDVLVGLAKRSERVSSAFSYQPRGDQPTHNFPQ